MRPAVLAAATSRAGFCCSPISARERISPRSTATTAPALYADAIDALIRWQRATREGELPAYDEALLARELDLFPDWYVAQHLGIVADARTGGHARSRVPRSSSTTISRNRASSSTATTMRAT